MNPSLFDQPTETGSLSREILEDLYENAPCGYLSTTPDDIVASVNQTFLRLTGRSRQEVIGLRFADLLTPGSQLFLETRYLPVLHLRGEVHEVALTLLHADGSEVQVLVNSVRIFEPDGSLRGTRSAVFDSTGRRDYERELLHARRAAEASASRLRALQNASSAFAASESEYAAADALVSSARLAFDATAAAVLLFDEDGGLSIAAGHYALLGSGMESLAIVSREAYFLSRRDPSIDPEASAEMSRARIDALSFAPLLSQDVVLGVLVTSFGRAREFDVEFIDLQNALARQASQVITRFRLQRQLEQLALYDQLTGLANRELSSDLLAKALDQSGRSGLPMALIVLDLDGFKTINDTLGHPIGDLVLQEVAGRLRAVVRADDVVGRFGGDEFLVVCEDADRAGVAAIAERIRDAVAQPLTGPAHAFLITASIGVTLSSGSPGASPSAAGLFEVTDAAMYVSKAAGKNRVTIVEA